ncbi:MAG: aminotransferase class V-fold PLP-dependent enzyme [Gemmatimonadaceae bacterium]
MPFGDVFLPNQADVRQEVLDAMLRRPISHRSAEFHRLFANIQTGLRGLFGTERPVYVATSSGTGMMEAAVRCAPRGRILALVNGAFGERFARIAVACDREVDRYEMPPGQVPEPSEVAELLSRSSYSTVTMVHSETSTGALADVRGIAVVCRSARAVTIVDSVSGIGGAPFHFDEWGVDCAVSASQKAIGLPPGLGFAVASRDFIRNAAGVSDRGVYLDLVSFDAHAHNNETPTTPAVSLLFALEAEIAEVAREGVEARWARHDAMRALVELWSGQLQRDTGLEVRILARAGARSPTVTVLQLSDVVRPEVLIADLAARGYLIGSGYGELATTSVRLGHMADRTVGELAGCLSTMEESLRAIALVG